MVEEIRATANRLFHKRPLSGSLKRIEDREFFLKLAALRVWGQGQRAL